MAMLKRFHFHFHYEALTSGKDRSERNKQLLVNFDPKSAGARHPFQPAALGVKY